MGMVNWSRHKASKSAAGGFIRATIPAARSAGKSHPEGADLCPEQLWRIMPG